MKMEVINVCTFCGAKHSVKVDVDKFKMWVEGNELIQNLMPELNATEREQLISGICPDCQADFFGDNEDE